MTEIKKDMAMLKAYLASKGVPRRKVDWIREVIMEDAMAEDRDLKIERIYTALALALNHAYGWNQVRIARVLRAFDQIMVQVADEDSSWANVMEELDRKTGIVIRAADTEDRLICEYKGHGARRQQIEKAEQEARG